MNNASLLEAYATLGISASPAEIKETSFPAGFSAIKALSPIPFGEQDVAEHPGQIHASEVDPIGEAEKMTKGKAADAIALGKAVAGRFDRNTSSGGDFKALIDAAMASANLPQLDFDPEIFATGAAMLGNSGEQSSAAPDFAGSAPFTGMRIDYRPESAPSGPMRNTARRHSTGAAHVLGDDMMIPSMLASMAEIAKGRKRGAGTGKVIKAGDIIKGSFGL